MSAEEIQVSQPVAEPTPAPAPVEAPSPAPAPAPDPKDLHAVVKHAAENPSSRGKHATLQPRTDQGKFAGPPQAPQTPVAPAIPRPALPKSISPKFQPHWEKADVEFLQAIAQREADYEKGVEPLKSAKSQLDEILSEFKPYEMLLKAENATPRQAIAPLLRTAAIFRMGTPIQKAQAVAQLLNQFGISMEHVQGALQNGAVAPQQPAIDPQVAQLHQQVQQLTAAQQQQYEARALAAIQEFAAKPEHEHFEAVSSQMLVLLQNPQILGPGVEVLSEQEKLKLAYESACWNTPEVRQKMLAKQQAKDMADRQASEQARIQQAKQAAVQVTGAPTAGPAPKVDPKDLHAVVRAAAQQRR